MLHQLHEEVVYLVGKRLFGSEVLVTHSGWAFDVTSEDHLDFRNTMMKVDIMKHIISIYKMIFIRDMSPRFLKIESAC